MEPTRLTLHRDFTVGEVSPYLFGGFLEHMGRAVYEGVYDPGSRHADADGFRADVLAALAELGFTIMRYPGGNFVSGYHWQDGIGPKDARPTVRDLAWQSLEPNQVGTEEFLALCRKMKWRPMLAVNLGTGTPEEARNWVEYCNAQAGTRFADLRVSSGSAEPHGVVHWCLGNEMDGPWQLGHVPAAQYAIRAQQAAKMMKDVDPSLQLTACGSSFPGMATYLEWDRVTLETVGELADTISLHRYVGNRGDNTAEFLAVSNSIDAQIEAVDACARYVQQMTRSERRAYLCFDEWNVWYKARTPADMDGEGKFAPHLVEEVYNLEDALVVAGFLMSFIRHADVMKIANLAQIVNVIAPLLTRGDELLKQSIFHAFRMISTRARGTALQVAVDGPGYDGGRYGRARFVDCAATLDGDRLQVFCTNRSSNEAMEVRLETTGLGALELVDAELLTAVDAKSFNSFEEPDVVRAEAFDHFEQTDGGGLATLPPLGFAALTLKVRA
jgi:alpha-N-arabinofuranosidase